MDGRCPECGQPLKINNMSHRRLKLLPLIVVLGLLGAGGYYAKIHFIDKKGPVIVDPNKPISDAGGGSTGGQDLPTTGDQPPQEGPVDRPTFGLENEANAKARRDVLARIDAMPHLTPAQKTKLTSSVDRARQMGCIFIIPFDTGKKALGQRETDILVKGFQSAGIQRLMEDPTLVFVILGYSDKQGDAQQSEKASIERAQSVLSAMKDRCNVQNVMYAVGMGGSQMFTGKSAGKNRLVEVWAVYP
jgi:outer membrane protein OmpA-like peptidoglycan-associated protein